MPVSLVGDIYRTTFNRSKAAGYEGSCYTLLRQPERALSALNEAAVLHDLSSLHRRSMHLADKGTVYAQLGDVQTACALLGEVLDVTE